MRYSLTIGVCALTLCGCAIGGALLVKPGSTVDLISASQNQVTLEFTHDYPSELPAAGRIADQQCGQFGRHAAFVSTTQETIDRSIATFRCE